MFAVYTWCPQSARNGGVQTCMDMHAHMWHAYTHMDTFIHASRMLTNPLRHSCTHACTPACMNSRHCVFMHLCMYDWFAFMYACMSSFEPTSDDHTRAAPNCNAARQQGIPQCGAVQHANRHHGGAGLADALIMVFLAVILNLFEDEGNCRSCPARLNRQRIMHCSAEDMFEVGR